jgi:nitroreductase
MEFQDVVRRRRMVREFTDEDVSEESLQRILRNARRGPSAGFSQGQEFLVLRGPDLARFWALPDLWAADGVTKAPLVIVPFANKDTYLNRYAEQDKGWTDRDEARWPVPFWYIDSGMAALLILQTVVDEGLGALYFGIAPEGVGKFRREFGIPDSFDPIGPIAIGHSAEDKPASYSSAITRRRRSVEEVVHYGQWG